MLIRDTECVDGLDEDASAVMIMVNNQLYTEMKDWCDLTGSEPLSVPYVTGKFHKDVTATALGAAF